MRHVHLVVILGALVGLLVVALPALAQTGDDYELSWWTVAGGGGISESDDQEYMLTGTIGQPATEALSEGEFSLVGGFLANESAAAGAGGGVYLPIIIR
jgi:hypothetical protein